MEAQVERSRKAVEDRQKDFEKENTKRYDVDPDDEVHTWAKNSRLTSWAADGADAGNDIRAAY